MRLNETRGVGLVLAQGLEVEAASRGEAPEHGLDAHGGALRQGLPGGTHRPRRVCPDLPLVLALQLGEAPRPDRPS